MKRILKLTALFLCLCVAVPAVYAQGKCSLQTITGTYAMYERGSSLIVNPSPSAQSFPYFVGAIAPFVNVAEVTFSPQGVGIGFYWIFIGAINGGFDPIPVHVTITEMNEDCTGRFRYSVTLPGIPSATIEERFIVFDNGREFRTVPTLIENGVGTLAWIGEGHRISKSSKPVNSCGPQTTHGTYLSTVESIIALNQTTAVAASALIRTDVSLTGDYTGMLYEKLGPVPIELPVSGTFTVNPNCSFSGTLNVPGLPGPVVIEGVFFNEGKEYYALALGTPGLPPEQQETKYSFGHGKRIGQ